MAKEKCRKKLPERRHIVPGQQAQRKREFIPSGGANLRPAYRDQSSKMGQSQLGVKSLGIFLSVDQFRKGCIAVMFLQPYPCD